MQQKDIIIDGLRVRYYQSDIAEPTRTLLFLHGWQSEALHFHNVLRECQSFVAIDLPGFGKSERPKGIWSVGDYANFLKAFLEKLSLQSPILAGHSFGGSIIIKYMAHGGEARKIILIDSSGIRKKGIKMFGYKVVAKTFNLILSLPGLSLIKQRARRRFYKAIDSEDYIQAGEMVGIYKKVIREDLQADMPKIKTDTVLIWGSGDTATPISQAKTMHKLIPDSQLHIIERAGHFPFIDQPEQFKQIFLKELSW